MLTETDISWESLEQSEGLNELLLRETQVRKLGEEKKRREMII